MRNCKAFTLMEIMVVVVIVGIIAAFGIPNYAKAGAKAQERVMITNLNLMRSAVDIIVDSGGVIGNWGNLAAINTNLGLSIIDPRSTYVCDSAFAFTSGCSASQPSGWRIEFHDEHSGRLLHCGAGTCPSCDNHPVTKDCET